MNGHYEKVPGAPLDYWVWSSQEALAMHVPERFVSLYHNIEPHNLYYTAKHFILN